MSLETPPSLITMTSTKTHWKFKTPMKIAQVIEVEPRWMQPPNARRYTDLPWAVIQEGIDCGLIKTIWLRNPMRKRSKTGILLIETASLVAFVESAGLRFTETETEEKRKFYGPTIPSEDSVK
jgi:hypothetical protein